MNNLDRIKSLRAQDYGVAGLSTTDVDWLIAEVGRLTAERDRYKAWHDAVLAQESVSVCTTKSGDLMMIERPQPLKENE